MKMQCFVEKCKRHEIIMKKVKFIKKQFILSKNFYLLPFDGLRWKFLKNV